MRFSFPQPNQGPAFDHRHDKGPSQPGQDMAAPLRPDTSHYEVLGVARDAPVKEIERAYKRLALLWHPDKNGNNVEESTARFKQIAEAWEVLLSAASCRGTPVTHASIAVACRCEHRSMRSRQEAACGITVTHPLPGLRRCCGTLKSAECTERDSTHRVLGEIHTKVRDAIVRCSSRNFTHVACTEHGESTGTQPAVFRSFFTDSDLSLLDVLSQTALDRLLEDVVYKDRKPVIYVQVESVSESGFRLAAHRCVDMCCDMRCDMRCYVLVCNVDIFCSTDETLGHDQHVISVAYRRCILWATDCWR